MSLDDEFCRRLSDDANRLLAAGFEEKHLWSMLKGLPYVQMWLHTPRLVEFENLPKGVKWKDARKFVYKHTGKYGYSVTLWLMPYGDDLYIKGSDGLVGTKKPYVIRNFRQYTACRVVQDVSRMYIEGEIDPDYASSIFTFWHEQGLPLGFQFGKPDAELREEVWKRMKERKYDEDGDT